MSLVTFPLFILTLSLLHLAQATTCQGYNCPTGLIITGGLQLRGWGHATSIETFPTGNCSIPPFRKPGRRGHSLSVVDNGRLVVACGGDDIHQSGTSTSCISWRSGQDEWTHYATLSQGRYNHAAVVVLDKIIIIGGKGNAYTGEIVKGGTQFSLRNGGEGTCAVTIPPKTGFVTIGGLGNHSRHGKVDRYDSEGKYLGSLPDLATPRAKHSCTTFVTNSGEQALLVAGGWNSDNGYLPSSAELFSSTEIFSNGRWRRGGNLTRAMFGLRAANLNQQVVVIGGDDTEHERDEVLQYNPSTDVWSQIGKLKRGRGFHGVAEVNLAAVGCVGPSTEAETLSTEAQETAGTEQDEVKRLIAKQFEEQKSFIAEQFAEQKRFIAEKFQIWLDLSAPAQEE